MTDARIPLLSPDDAMAAAEEHGVPAQLAGLNVFRLLLRRPRIAKATADLLISLLFRGVLDDRLRELVIMRIGWATGSDYEWTQHWTLAQDAFGCHAEELLAVRDWARSDLLGDPERAVLAVTDETLATGTVSSVTFEHCRAVIGDDDALIELVLAVGLWRTVSQLTRSLEIPLEDGVASWPPDSLRPA
jgi:alkylhydroperoxidase family enzyme